MMTDPNKPMLYVLMRTDLPDYMPGKSMAQANHAGTAFVVQGLQSWNPYGTAFREWLDEGGGGFGTCIVLGVDYRTMLARQERAHHLGLVTEIITDPGYPIRDGHRVVTPAVETCAYVFGPAHRCALVTCDLPLFRDGSE
jgi:peptidyl-tRNA hydrolase